MEDQIKKFFSGVSRTFPFSFLTFHFQFYMKNKLDKVILLGTLSFTFCIISRTGICRRNDIYHSIWYHGNNQNAIYHSCLFRNFLQFIFVAPVTLVLPFLLLPIYHYCAKNFEFIHNFHKSYFISCPH